MKKDVEVIGGKVIVRAKTVDAVTAIKKAVKAKKKGEAFTPIEMTLALKALLQHAGILTEHDE